jgi:hypothetical protein
MIVALRSKEVRAPNEKSRVLSGGMMGKINLAGGDGLEGWRCWLML